MKKKPTPPVSREPQEVSAPLLVHPSEVDAFSRRSLLQNGISLTGYLSVAQMLGLSQTAKAQTSYSPQRRLVWINMSGGWDILEVTDPKVSSTANIQMMYGWDQAQALAGAANEKIGRWMPRIATRGNDLLVVRGLSMGTTAHDAGSIYMDTGVLSNAGRVNAASVPAIVASESGATVPIIQLNGGTEPMTDRGLLKPVSVVRAQNLELYRSMYPAAGTELERKMLMLDYVKSSVERAQAEVGANDRLSAVATAEDKIRNQFNDNVGSKLALSNADRAAYMTADAPKNMNTGARDAFALAAKLLKNNLVTCVNLGIGGFDTHAGQEQRMQPIMESFDFLMAAFLDDLRASGNLDNTLIVVFSDFGRTPRVNNSAGRDHWPTGGALMLGGGIQGGRVVGATDDSLLATKVNFTTGTTAAAEDYLSPIHLGGSVLALTLGSAYVSYRTYLKDIPALTKLKSS
jgi:uncharacterized protein (DUF1501 family)